MKKTIVMAGAASALLFGAVAIAQTPAEEPTPADQPPAAQTTPAEREASGATTASEYGEDASGTAMDDAGERG